MERQSNHLIRETSPYLLQHAYNPVAWYPWGEEALSRAKHEDKPILLSIGYSACHWCHVMEHESFENEEIASFMNEHFINIKVDREERPDLDELYMASVQLMIGRGGWPLTVFLTSDLKPFFGGMYFPPEDRWGRPGFLSVLEAVAVIYRKERDGVVAQAERLTQHLKQASTRPASSGIGLPTQDLLRQAYLQSLGSFDRQHGGFGGAPKFPRSMELSFLLRYWHRTGDCDALHVVEYSLEKMARGSIYDQLGGGFHRYSVDAQWRVPHFEKMLYDNALLAWTYLEAYQATKQSFYCRVAEETLEYVLREMTSSEGGFYASQDADSPGGEGACFIWTPREIQTVLGEKDGALACEYFGVTETGNFEQSTSLLHLLSYTPEEFAQKAQVTLPEFAVWLGRIKNKLFEARERRAKPRRDGKILTAWNGLMISAFARAYQVLGHERYLRAAENTARFCLAHLKKHGKLLRGHTEGQAKFSAYLEDYAFFVTGLLDLYEANFDLLWLKEAQALSTVMIQQFWDETRNGFFFTGKDHDPLPVRLKNAYDASTPSGNSAAALALLRLAELRDNQELRAKAEQTLRVFRDLMEQTPQSFSHMICALDFYLGPSVQVAVVGDQSDPRTKRFLEIIRTSFIPNKIVALKESISNVKELEMLIPVLKGKMLFNGASAVYVCQNYSCRAPITETEELEKMFWQAAR